MKLLYKTLLVFTISFFTLNLCRAQSTVFINGVEVLDKTIIIKIKPQFKNYCSLNEISIPKIKLVFNQLGVSSITQKFPNSLTVNLTKNAATNPKMVDITTIYEIKYNSTIPLNKAYTLFNSIVEVEYAEPKVLPKLLFTPNDSDIALQYYLTNVRAYEGWDIEQGNANMVIGISDTGYNFSHPDLSNQVKHNIYDPIDGVDNDADGYIDNYSGWDLGNNDNDASVGGIGHGIHVAGLAGGEVNNNFGIAGLGYNCKLLPLKIDNSAGQLVGSYESIVYGADHGCKIINCSWGSNGFSQFGEDIVNYAIFNRNVLVIGAAGNNNNDIAFYPGSFKYVLNVAGTDINDVKWTGSTYGTTVDVSAPGDAIYSTWLGSGFTNSGGTSMAAPITAGLAGIVWSHFPNYSALQVAEQIKVTCDNINGIAGNAAYIDMLGSGRVNMLRALTETSSPSFVLEDVTITDNNDNNFLPSETIDIIGNFKNYLANSTNTFVSLSTNSAFVTIVDNNTNIGAVTSGSTATNTADPFKISLLANTPLDHIIQLKFTIFDGTYSTVEYDSLVVNTSYYNLNHNAISTSITGIGRIGYQSLSNYQGVGLSRSAGSTLLYEGGLMIGNSISKVSDGLRGINSEADNDFLMLQRPQKVIPTVFSEYDLFAKFNDNNAATTKLNIEVDQKTYAWNTTDDKNYIVLDYNIINKGSSTLTNVFAGIFTDWDITFAGSNKALVDASNKLGYVYDVSSGGNYAAVQLLSTSAPFNFYAIDNDAGSSGGINISDNFTTAEKYTVLSTSKKSAGDSDNGGDVMTVVSSGPFGIIPGDTINVVFAIHATSSLTDLITSAKAAKAKFTTDVLDSINKSEYKSKVHLFDNIPNPVEHNTTISFYIPVAQYCKLKIYNSSGQLVSTLLNENLSEGYYNIKVETDLLNAGLYFYSLESTEKVETKKMQIVK